MIFNHLVLDLSEEIESNNNRNNVPFILLDDDIESDDAKIVSQAISLDIRGDYGFFLNRYDIESLKSNDIESIESYEWTGNLFHIVVNPKNHVVTIEDLLDEENERYTVSLEDWQEALLDWKNFYLTELGFLDFPSVALSHMMGVLILTFDQISTGSCYDEMISESIKKCAERYGVNSSVIYRDCKKITGLYSIELFCDWAKNLLEDNIGSDILLHEFVMSQLDKYADIRHVISERFNVII